MVQRRKEEDDIASATGKRPVPDMDIMEEVLGHRSSYRRGFGYGMPIDEHRVDYYEQPRHEDLVHSEYDRTAQQEKYEKLEQKVEWLMSYVRAPPMPSPGQYPSSQAPGPHMGAPPMSSSGQYPSFQMLGSNMGAPGSSSHPQQPSYTSFTPAPSHLHPQHGFHGIPGHPSMFQHAPHDLPQQPSGSTGQQGGSVPSGFAPWAGPPTFGHSSPSTPIYHPYAFPHTPTQPSASHPSSSSTSPSTISQSTTVRGTGRSRQRQHQRRH